jgi:hypothetical protein
MNDLFLFCIWIHPFSQGHAPNFVLRSQRPLQGNVAHRRQRTAQIFETGRVHRWVTFCFAHQKIWVPHNSLMAVMKCIKQVTNYLIQIPPPPISRIKWRPLPVWRVRRRPGSLRPDSFQASLARSISKTADRRVPLGPTETRYQRYWLFHMYSIYTCYCVRLRIDKG